MTMYIPKTITPKQQYMLYKTGELKISINIAKNNIEISITITIPHFKAKSVGVKIA